MVDVNFLHISQQTDRTSPDRLTVLLHRQFALRLLKLLTIFFRHITDQFEIPEFFIHFS